MMIELTNSTVPLVIGVAISLFAFGYAIGHAVGTRDGEDRVHDYYEGRRR